jgi:uncharacterized protein YcbK (DUF882 family)
MPKWNSEYFNRDEFACKCGCGFNTIDYELVKILEIIRHNFDRPMRITSACRCESHNRAVQGSSGSWHRKGRAADVQIDEVPPVLILELARELEVPGLGSYETFTHIDTRNGPPARWEG